MASERLVTTQQIADLASNAIVSEDKGAICFVMYVMMIRFGIKSDTIVPSARHFQQEKKWADMELNG